jgi:signal transduction histidine kinase
MDQTTSGSFRPTTKISSVRWRWVFPAGIGVAVLTYLSSLVVLSASFLVLQILTGAAPDESQEVVLAYIMADWGLLVLHFLLTVPVAAWVARKAGAEPNLHGVLVSLVSALGLQLIDLPNGPPNFDELTRVSIVAIGAGLLGSRLAQATLRGQKALYRASRDINVARSPKGIISAVGKHLADPERVSQVSLWRAEPQTEEATPTEVELDAVWTPRGAKAWPSGLRFDTARVSALANLWQQSSLLLKAGELPASERAVWEQRGTRSALLLPLITSSDEQVGLLMVASRRAYGFSRSATRRYLTIGAQVALALENLRLVQEARQAGISRERQRLAREIHDTLAQGFTSIVMHLTAAEMNQSSAFENEACAQHLEEARHTARESLADARRLVWALRPEALDRHSLPEALRRLAEEWSREHGVEASAITTGTQCQLIPEVEVALMRIAQEALTNIRKYARASRVNITLSYLGENVVLDVLDDGIGFDPTQLKTEVGALDTGGFGLVGMRERVEQLGGTLLIESAPGEGTTLVVELPVTGGSEDEAEGQEGRPEAPMEAR